MGLFDDALDIQISDKELARLFKVFRLQVPFAVASALTKTANDMLPGMRTRMSKALKIRSRGLPKAAFNPRRSVVRAEKKDFPNSKAVLGVPNDPKFRGAFLRDHVTGARRKSTRGGRLAIPTRAIKRNSKGRVAKSKTPSAILAKSKGYLFDDSGGARIGLSKGKRSKDKRETLYILRKTVKIRKTWEFEHDANELFADFYSLAIRVRFLQAIKTAKKGKSKSNAGLVRRGLSFF